MPYYYGRDGTPLGMIEWARKHASQEYCRVATSDIELPGGGTAWVSTVWLGLDYNWSDEGPPLIFETMVFVDGATDYQVRTPTEDAALAEHDQACAWVKSMMGRLTR